MIGQVISHYKILEKLGEARPTEHRPVVNRLFGRGGMSQNHPRTFFVSGCDFEPARLVRCNTADGDPTKRREVGGGR